MQKTIFSHQNTKLVTWLKEKRLESNLSMRALAQKLGKSHSLIERIEHQDRRLDVCEFVTYCEAINADPFEGIQLIQDAKLLK